MRSYNLNAFSDGSLPSNKKRVKKSRAYSGVNTIDVKYIFVKNSSTFTCYHLPPAKSFSVLWSISRSSCSPRRRLWRRLMWCHFFSLPTQAQVIYESKIVVRKWTLLDSLSFLILLFKLCWKVDEKFGDEKKKASSSSKEFLSFWHQEKNERT